MYVKRTALRTLDEVARTLTRATGSAQEVGQRYFAQAELQYCGRRLRSLGARLLIKECVFDYLEIKHGQICINGNAIRPGNVIEHKNRLWRAVKIQHTQPGKGGAYLQVELRDIRDGTKLNGRFRASEDVERVRLDQRDYQYLYAEGDNLAFMNPETYDQVPIPKGVVGPAARFLKEEDEIEVEFFDELPEDFQSILRELDIDVTMV